MQDLIRHLEQATGQGLQGRRLTPVGGGDINRAYRLQTGEIDWFLKINRADLSSMFEAEAAGLKELAAQQAIKVPAVVVWGSHRQHAYLVLEHIPLTTLRDQSERLLGRQLAQLHRPVQAYFGWSIDNTIGSTPQHNDRSSDWSAFWQYQRLGKQLQFAAANGHTGKLQNNGAKLLEKIPDFFSDYRPHPALLHGDLWGGNAAADHQGQPVIYDPACYYGDRETDLAMTELFGGFGLDFHASYRDAYPLDSGYPTRKRLYNLYHILNHLNLFGGGYLSQANAMIEQLLAE